MAQPRYRIQMMNPHSWEPIAYFEETVRVEWSRKVNDVSDAKITIPDTYPVSMFPRDTRILIWREKDFNTTLAGQTVWMVRRIDRDLKDGLLRFTAKDANILIENRLVAYLPETKYADKTQEEYDNPVAAPLPVSDDMVKRYVYENMSTGAINVDRRLSTGLFSVEADQGLGVFVEYTGSYQNLLEVIRGVATQSKDAGTPVFFDMIPNTSDGSFLFRTWVNFRGRNRSADSDDPLTFSQELENITKVTLEFDYETEYNTLYFLGEGAGHKRLQELYENAASIRNDPFGRREFVTEDSNRENRDSYMDTVARGLLEGAKATVTVKGQAVDTPLSRYGVDYDLGDKVSVQAGGYEFDAFISAVSVKYEKGKENISIKLESTIQVLE